MAQKHAGGPAAAAGARYHYLHAAARLLDLLDDPDNVLAVRIEGAATEDDTDSIDYVVERASTVELVQAKWSGRRASGRTMNPSEWWTIVGKLWSDAHRTEIGHRKLQLTLLTNRRPSPKLVRQLDVWESWREMPPGELLAALTCAASAVGPAREVHQELQSLFPGDWGEQAALNDMRRLLAAGNWDIRDTPNVLGTLESELRMRLRSRALEPRIKAILDLVTKSALPGAAGTPIDRQMVADALGLPSTASLRHDFAMPAEYSKDEGFDDWLDGLVLEQARDGGTLVLVGAPGSGKSTQLRSWADDVGVPFYACRVGERLDDIRARADAEMFVRDVIRQVAVRFPGRVGSVNFGNDARPTDLRARIASVFDQLAANSTAADPAILIVDGTDDAWRELDDESFLTVIPAPPPNVVVVISTQSVTMLPHWLRTSTSTPSVSILQVPHPSGAVVRHAVIQMLGWNDSHGADGTDEHQPMLEKIFDASAGNWLAVRLICRYLRTLPESSWMMSFENLRLVDSNDLNGLLNRMLGLVPPDSKRLIRNLALTEAGLTILEMCTISGLDDVSISEQIHKWRFILDESGDRRSVRHPVIRRYIKDSWFTSQEALTDAHKTLASLSRSAKPESALYPEQAEHLASCGKWDDVANLVDQKYIFGLLEEFHSPSTVRHVIQQLQQAAANLTHFGSAVRARLLSTRLDDYLESWYVNRRGV